MYDLIEVFASCNISIIDLSTGNTVANFGPQDVRSLLPVNSSNSKIQATVQRDLFKELRPMLERNLKNAHFSRKAQQNSNAIDNEADDDTSMPEIIE